MRRMLFTISALVMVLFANAQVQTITGKVTDERDGSPLVGATVVEKGTANGVATDSEGNFSITVQPGSKSVLVNFIGMKPKEVAITKDMKVSLEYVSTEIGDVIVVAYGTAKKATFTGTATQVSGEKLVAKNTSNVVEALTGESAGLQVINSDGQPGSVATVRIRGIGSINGDRNPLYVVDGVPLLGSLNSINPSDIASVSVLKDASATSIYGSRGSNGVILITTKRGKNGVSKIDVDANYGVNSKLLPDYDVINSPEQFMELSYLGLYNRAVINGESDPSAYANNYLFSKNSIGIDPYYNMWNADGDQLIDPATGKFKSGISRRYTPEKWKDELFQNAQRFESNIRFSGGSDKSSYFTSLGYLKEDGYLLNSGYKRFSARSNIDQRVKAWLKASTNMSYTRSESEQAGQSTDGGATGDSNNGFWYINNMPSIYPVYARDNEGNLIPDLTIGGNVYDFGDGTYGTRRFASLANPVATNTLDIDKTTSNMFSGNEVMEASFLKNFKFKSQLGLEYRNSSRDDRANPWYGGAATSNGSIYKVKNEYFSYTFLNMLSYDKSDGDNTISAFVAHEASYYQRKYLSAFKSNLVDPDNLELDNAVVSSPSSSFIDDYAIESYFAQIKYDYVNKYFLQGVIRRDGSSRFKNNKWGTFGSIGAAWMITNEDFMSPITYWLEELKLKASFGTIGSQAGMGYYTGDDLYQVGNLDGEAVTSFYSKGNPDLTWEKSNMFQVGVEFDIKKIVDGSIDYYVKNTSNLFFQRRVPISLGYSVINVNDGELRNSGLEFNLNTHILNTKDWKFDFSVNGAFQSNELTKMPLDPATGEPKFLDLSTIYGRAKGHSVYDLYTREYAGVDEQTGASTWYKYYNEYNGSKEYISDMSTYESQHKGEIGTIGKETTTNYAEATNKFIGKSAIPVIQGAFNMSVNYKGFDLSSQFTYSLGGYGMDYNYRDLMGDGMLGSNNWSKDILNSWKIPGDKTNVPAITAGRWNNTDKTSDRFVTSTNYLALNNIRLSYNFSKELTQKLQLNNLKVWVSGSNLWVGTKRKGFNPSTSEAGSSSRYQYSPLSSIVTGVSFQF